MPIVHCSKCGKSDGAALYHLNRGWVCGNHLEPEDFGYDRISELTARAEQAESLRASYQEYWMQAQRECEKVKAENKVLLDRCEKVFTQEYQKQLESERDNLRDALRRLRQGITDEVEMLSAVNNELFAGVIERLDVLMNDQEAVALLEPK